MMKRLNLALTALAASAALAGGVAMEKKTITLPTYAPGGYDKTPVFYTGRVYQGESARSALSRNRMRVSCATQISLTLQPFSPTSQPFSEPGAG